MLGKLIVIGAAVLNIGTINEADGIVERSFWLRNDGCQPVAIVQGYTSCGCTTVAFPKDSLINVGDSVAVTLRFNPRGKGGEFYESATLSCASRPGLGAQSPARDHLSLALEGTCITSEETLLLQHPIAVSETLRLSRNRFDLGYMSVGAVSERTVSVWHRDTNQTEPFTISLSITPDMKKGLNHVPQVITIHTSDGDEQATVVFDVIVR